MAQQQKKAQPAPKQWKSLSYEIPLPEGVSASYDGATLTVSGAKGEVSKRLKYSTITFTTREDAVVIHTDHLSQREKRMMGTYRAHVKNLIKGASEGFTYKLAVLYAKFPMTVENNNGVLSVKNLLGEKVPRTIEIPSDVTVTVDGQEITVNGIDKERTGQVAAQIEQLTTVTHLDRRVVQDGIYITEKPHRRYV